MKASVTKWILAGALFWMGGLPGLLHADIYLKYKMMPGAREGMSAATKELAKIKGVNVLTVSTAKMMNTQVKTTQELLDFAEKKAPGDFYDPPAGFARRDM